LGQEYGITDYDGRQPDIVRHFAEENVPSSKWFKEAIQRHIDWLDRIARRGERYLIHAKKDNPQEMSAVN
jgi:hypothetical protein